MISSLVVGGVLLLMGLILRFSGVERNSLFGYRTFLAMKNERNWNYANKTFGIHAVVISLLCFLLGFFAYYFKIHERYCVFIVMTMLLTSIIIIEVGLKKFDKMNSPN